MRILITQSAINVLMGMLYVSLAVIIFIIAYKKLLAYFGKNAPAPENYCVLYGLETHPASEEVEFYFTSSSPRKITLELLNDDLTPHSTIVEKDVDEGGNIIRFNTRTIPNGTYFYQLRTENQKTMKRFTITNN